MERVGAGNLLGTSGNMGLDGAGDASATALGNAPSASLRGRQESPFEGGPKSFLSSTHLKSPSDVATAPAQGGARATFGEILGLVQQVIALVEKLFAGKAEAAPAKLDTGDAMSNPSASKPDTQPNTPTAAPAPAAPAAPAGGVNEMSIFGEILSILKDIVALLEKKFGNSNETKGNDGPGGPSKSDDPQSSAASDKEIVAQIIDLVTQLIDFLKQRLGGGEATSTLDKGKQTVEEGLNNIKKQADAFLNPASSAQPGDLLTGLEELKGKLESLSGDSGITASTPDGKSVNVKSAADGMNTIQRPAENEAPTNQPSLTAEGAKGDQAILQILDILGQIVSILENIAGADKKAAA